MERTQSQKLAGAPLVRHRSQIISALTMLGVASLIAANIQAAPAQPAQARSNTVGNTKPKSDAAPATPSKYPGVTVSNAPAVPATGTPATGTNKHWIYVKPGASKPHLAPRQGTRGDGIWYEPGKTSAGGTIAHVTPRFYPYTKAKAPAKPDGKASATTAARHAAASPGTLTQNKSSAAVKPGKTRQVAGKNVGAKPTTPVSRADAAPS